MPNRLGRSGRRGGIGLRSAPFGSPTSADRGRLRIAATRNERHFPAECGPRLLVEIARAGVELDRREDAVDLRPARDVLGAPADPGGDFAVEEERAHLFAIGAITTPIPATERA